MGWTSTFIDLDDELEPLHRKADEADIAFAIAAYLMKLQGRTVCEGVTGRCFNTEGVERIPCRTMYVDDSQNVDPILCPECAEAYNELWDERWAEYNRGLL